jgi:hypothetical protein
VPVIVAVALPLLLAVAVVAIAITARVGGFGDGAPEPRTGPLAVVPADAPDASGPECDALLAALPAELPTGDDPLPPRPVAEPAPPGVRAWAAWPRPAVLRCGMPRPAELTPASALIEINGVRWLELADDVPEPVVVSYVAVDRPVYVVLTVPVETGSGPVQAVSDAVRATLPLRGSG